VLIIVLQNKLPRYEYWARRQRAWVEAKINTRPADQVEAIGEGTQTAVESVHRRLDKLDTMDTKMNAQDQRIATLEAGQQSTIRMLEQLTQGTAPANNRPAPAAAPPAPAPARAARAQGEYFCFFRHFFIL
jgi:hypothetical protein